MTKIVYEIKALANEDLIAWAIAQPGFDSIVDQQTFTLFVRYDHDNAAQDTFRKALGDRLNLTPDDIVNPNILITDAVLYTSENSITKTALSSSYVNLFTDFNGRPFVVDTTGYTKLAVQIFWNKNGGASNHDFRIIDHPGATNVLYEKLNLTNGINLDVNITLPAAFVNFKGQLRFQVKSGNGTDNPIFSAVRLYLRR